VPKIEHFYGIETDFIKFADVADITRSKTETLYIQYTRKKKKKKVDIGVTPFLGESYRRASAEREKRMNEKMLTLPVKST
jgi:hypothetical protein